MHHDEQRRPVFFDLRALVALLRVFDGELVQVELLLQRGQLAGLRILQRDPDEAVAAIEVRAHLAQRNVAEPSARAR